MFYNPNNHIKTEFKSFASASQLQLSPSVISVRIGETATFSAIHPYTTNGVWSYDASLNIVENTNKLLRIKAEAIGDYSISYSVNGENKAASLHVIEETGEEEWTDPVEPAPPSLPDSPPSLPGTPNLIIDLMDASKPIPPLHMYPNIMKRNARYRGQRESEKVLNNHQEQIYDIRKLYQGVQAIDEMKDITTTSWFMGEENNSIYMKVEECGRNQDVAVDDSSDITVDSIRGFSSDVIQLSGNSLEENIVGIYGIKRRMQELDERIAEAERRYNEYENAYE
jgi:hypothetical protein